MTFGPRKHDEPSIFSLKTNSWYLIFSKEGRFYVKVKKVTSDEVRGIELARVPAQGGYDLQERTCSIAVPDITGHYPATEAEIDAAKRYTYPLRALLNKTCCVEKGDRIYRGKLAVAYLDNGLILKPHILFVGDEPSMAESEQTVYAPFDSIYGLPWSLDKELERLKARIAKERKKSKKR